MASSNLDRSPLLEVQDLRKYFRARRLRKSVGRGAVAQFEDGFIRAVDGVSFALGRGQTLGLVGESGSGKTTLARVILRLIPATSGKVLFDGQDVLSLPGRELRRLRRRMQIIFQDPLGSLNPRLTVEQAIGEVLEVHRLVRGRRERTERVIELLRLVGLPPEACGRYPHEFSGGQRQRIVIARALAVGPELIICDEPVSALDVSVQAQVLNLLDDLQRRLGLSYLLIAHNLAVIRQCSDYVAVMYRGRIVEYGPAEAVYEWPSHPYTQALLAAAPRLDQPLCLQEGGDWAELAEAGEAGRIGDGCQYAGRCSLAEPICREQVPALCTRSGLQPGHAVACHAAGSAAAPEASRGLAARLRGQTGGG